MPLRSLSGEKAEKEKKKTKKEKIEKKDEVCTINVFTPHATKPNLTNLKIRYKKLQPNKACIVL